jgi:hypothetical protein
MRENHNNDSFMDLGATIRHLIIVHLVTAMMMIETTTNDKNSDESMTIY